MLPIDEAHNHVCMQGASKLNMTPRVPEQPKKGLPRQVVYAPACVTRMMGPASSDSEQASVHEKLLSLFDKAGYEVIYPEVSSKLTGSAAGGCVLTSAKQHDLHQSPGLTVVIA